MSLIYYYSIFASLLLFGVMLLMTEWGRSVAKKALLREGTQHKVGTAVIEGAIFGLMGLIIAFTFSNSASRFEARRQLIVSEANAIGTAYWRIDLLPSGAQAKIRQLFREYLDLRIRIYQDIPDLHRSFHEIQQSQNTQQQIWNETLQAIHTEPSHAAPLLFIPALNQMFDLENQRNNQAHMHIPIIIVAMLFFIGVVCAFLAGYSMGGPRVRNWIHRSIFCAITALTFYLILDLEYPRIGFIRVDSSDRTLLELKEKIK